MFNILLFIDALLMTAVLILIPFNTRELMIKLVTIQKSLHLITYSIRVKRARDGSMRKFIEEEFKESEDGLDLNPCRDK